MKFLAAFFAFGATLCGLTVVLLLFPRTRLDRLWRLNPDAQAALHTMGPWAFALMLGVGIACAFAAVGLWHPSRWGAGLAIAVLSVNLVGDLSNAVFRHDYRALIGLPIAAAMIFYLARARPAARASTG